ncbi:MAG TPA: DUF3109 family protein [Balneolales bacterium]|nr:DUF3109 family protein [Balneolales bacterium]
MFQVKNVVISDDVANAKFACDLHKCKGACCVVGDAGAPVKEEEIPVLKKAYRDLKGELRKRAVEVVEEEGLIVYPENEDPELNCTDGNECVFVTYDDNGVATCAIHKAYREGRFPWMKPISCHLYPLRIKTVGGKDYVNFEYVPSLCSAACSRAEREGIYLADFVRDALVRQYGVSWYDEFRKICKDIRVKMEA